MVDLCPITTHQEFGTLCFTYITTFPIQPNVHLRLFYQLYRV
jgi:hypothetical protein